MSLGFVAWLEMTVRLYGNKAREHRKKTLWGDRERELM